jgi:hypothetical protein
MLTQACHLFCIIQNRRGHSVVIVLKGSAADTTLTTANTSNSSSSEQVPAEIEYLMNQAYQCVQSITQVLQQLGIPGHQVSSRTGTTLLLCEKCNRALIERHSA